MSRRISPLRPGFFVSDEDPEEIIERWTLLDTARLRAARLSKRLGKRLFVWDWDPANGYRRTRSSAEKGLVYWHRPCRKCPVPGAGCDACTLMGSIIDPDAPVDHAGDSI